MVPASAGHCSRTSNFALISNCIQETRIHWRDLCFPLSVGTSNFIACLPNGRFSKRPFPKKHRGSTRVLTLRITSVLSSTHPTSFTPRFLYFMRSVRLRSVSILALVEGETSEVSSAKDAYLPVRRLNHPALYFSDGFRTTRWFYCQAYVAFHRPAILR
jgi:hypothetical protein